MIRKIFEGRAAEEVFSNVPLVYSVQDEVPAGMNVLFFQYEHVVFEKEKAVTAVFIDYILKLNC